MIRISLSTSADLGRISPDEKVLKQVINCPKMVWDGKTQNRPTMALEQCVMRVKIKSTCVVRCQIADQIRLALAQGYDVDV
jgi:hypothetical protein